jgi:signal transduction histidine kinase
MMIDPDGIHRAVLNIVTNAIDAAENVEGAHVTVATAYDAGNEAVQISVADNGVGISEADLASIFQVFASTKGARGTGLGLPVSQKIVREHGGKIVVTSKPGQGSQFTIELPLKRAEPGKGSSGTREVPALPG